MKFNLDQAVGSSKYDLGELVLSGIFFFTAGVSIGVVPLSGAIFFSLGLFFDIRVLRKFIIEQKKNEEKINKTIEEVHDTNVKLQSTNEELQETNRNIFSTFSSYKQYQPFHRYSNPITRFFTQPSLFPQILSPIVKSSIEDRLNKLEESIEKLSEKLENIESRVSNPFR